MAGKDSLSRRDFIKKSVVAGAALAVPAIVPSSALGADGAVAPGERIVMGAIGIGWQGTANLLNLLGKREVQFVAVCDVDTTHLEKAKRLVDKQYGNQDCKTYRDFRELLARGDLDAVCIALPDHWHAIPAIAAARAGLDIHGEKPLSHSLLEGRAMCEAVKRYGRVWQTGSWQRSRADFHHACELIRNGRIGKISKVEVGLGGGYSDYTGTQGQEAPVSPPAELDYERWLGPAPWAPYCPPRVHKNWRWHLDYGGGRMMDWVGHHVDIALWGLGLEDTGPITVEGWGEFPGEGLWNAPTDYEFTCQFAGGLQLIVGSKMASGTKWYGEDGWIYVNRQQIDAEPRSVLDEVIGPGEIRLSKSRDHMQNFVDCIKSRRPAIAPCEAAHRSASIGHLGQIAMLTGRRIKWNPEREEILDDPGATTLLGHSYREPWGL